MKNENSNFLSLRIILNLFCDVTKVENFDKKMFYFIEKEPENELLGGFFIFYFFLH
jgi:hypothetical protein